MAKNARPMALDVGPDADLDAEMQAYFAKCEEKLGFVPNVFKAYAFDNTKLRAFVAMSDDLMLGDSGLSKLEREMIAVAVSSVNHCHYCLTSHGAAVRQRAVLHAEHRCELAHRWRVRARKRPRSRVELAFRKHLAEVCHAVAFRIEADEQHVEPGLFVAIQLTLRLAQRVDDQRADVLARGIEHADELHRAATRRQTEIIAGVVGQRDRQSVDRVARQFRGERKSRRQRGDEEHRQQPPFSVVRRHELLVFLQ